VLVGLTFVHNAHKLQFRSRRCAFFGYSNMHKGFKYLDISTSRIYISHDVIFYENIFPFAELPNNSGSCYTSEILLDSESPLAGNNTDLSVINVPTNQVPAVVISSHAEQNPHMLPVVASISGAPLAIVPDDLSEANHVTTAAPDSEQATSPVGGDYTGVAAGPTTSPACASRSINQAGSPACAPGPTDTTSTHAHLVSQLSPDTAVHVESQLIRPSTLPSMHSMLQVDPHHIVNPTPTIAPVQTTRAIVGLGIVADPMLPSMCSMLQAAPPINSGDNSVATQPPSVDSAPSTNFAPRTRLQAGISKPKVYTDGTVRYGFLSTTSEPGDISSALSDPNWKAAMESEYSALIRNNTWHLVPPSPGHNLIDCKWVYKIKRKADDFIDRYKGRLVAKGFKQ
jgi:hypothetical protein